MLIPYRSKNPPEHYPYVTISLIAINTIVYALTSDDLLSIREEVVNQYAVSHQTLSLLRLLTAMFLHGNPMHLIGNMLFLWLFGCSVEGRLRPLKFILVYLVTGILGSLLQDVITGFIQPDQFGYGASGAIMGITGAYLYMFPFGKICVFWWFYFRLGTSEWQAQWIILLYAGLDLFEGFLMGSMDGVGHFAHLGGVGAGFLLAMMLQAKRDSESRSEAQATRAVAKDWNLLSFYELEALMEHPTDDINLVMAFFRKAVTKADPASLRDCLAALHHHSRLLMAKADPVELAKLALWIPTNVGAMPQPFYMVLGPRVESAGVYDTASLLYRRAYEIDPAGPDAEMALFRLGRLLEQHSSDKSGAVTVYREMLRLFPYSSMAYQAQDAIRRFSGSAGLHRTQAIDPDVRTIQTASQNDKTVVQSGGPVYLGE